MEFYLLDIDSVEYPAELQQLALNDEKIDAELLKRIFAACREVKDRLLDDFKKTFSRNVYKISALGVRLSDDDLSSAIQYCSKENHLDVGMSDFFQALTSDIKNVTDSLIDQLPSAGLDKEIGESAISLEETVSGEGERLQLGIYENLIDNLITAFFKKIDSNMYVEQPQPIEAVLQRSQNVPTYLDEFTPLSRKVIFLPIKLKYFKRLTWIQSFFS